MGKLMQLDMSGFEKLLEKIDALDGNVQEAISDALGQAAETIRDDTADALSAGNLPAGGKYSLGDTKASIVSDTAPRWEGMTVWVPVGFDFSKHGAGGYLISGTPRMRPDYQLQKMYKQKRYMKQIQQDIWDVLMDYFEDAMG